MYKLNAQSQVVLSFPVPRQTLDHEKVELKQSKFLRRMQGIHIISYGIRVLTKTVMLLGGNELHAPSQSTFSRDAAHFVRQVIQWNQISVRQIDSGNTFNGSSNGEGQSECQLFSLLRYRVFHVSRNEADLCHSQVDHVHFPVCLSALMWVYSWIASLVFSYRGYIQGWVMEQGWICP